MKLYGLDYSKEAINFAKIYNHEVPFCVASLTEEIPFEDNFFDQIILIETLEHIEPSQIHRIVSELNRVLKPSGTLIVTVPHQNRPLSSKHYQHFSSNSLKSCLVQQFEIKEMYGLHKSNFWSNLPFHLLTIIYYYMYPLEKIGLSLIVRKLTKLGYFYFKKFLYICAADDGLTLFCLAVNKKSH